MILSSHNRAKRFVYFEVNETPNISNCFIIDDVCVISRIFCDKFYEPNESCLSKLADCFNFDLDTCKTSNTNLINSCFYGKCD